MGAFDVGGRASACHLSRSGRGSPLCHIAHRRASTGAPARAEAGAGRPLPLRLPLRGTTTSAVASSANPRFFGGVSVSLDNAMTAEAPTEKQREAMELRDAGLSLRAIAERLGISTSTVRARLDPKRHTQAVAARNKRLIQEARAARRERRSSEAP